LPTRGGVGRRPFAVDLLGIIILISAIVTFLSGLGSLGFAVFLSAVAPIHTAVPGIAQGASAAAEYVAITGAIILVIGIGEFIVSYGLFSRKNWGWSAAMALAIIGIVIPIINIIFGYWPSIFTLLLSGLIIYYLVRKDVRMYFGRKFSAKSDTAAA